MALETVITTNRLAIDPIGRDLIQYFSSHYSIFGTGDTVLYYDFPTYTDYSGLQFKPDILLASQRKGLIAITIASLADGPRHEQTLFTKGQHVAEFCSQLISRLIRSSSLREPSSNSFQLRFPVVPVLFVENRIQGVAPPQVIRTLTSHEGLAQYIGSLPDIDIESLAFYELRSVIEGAKALTKPQKRAVEDPARQTVAVALSSLEAEIANFDQKQRRAALISIKGPQRIRGLAGSGKTVILAMKCAHIHINNPDDTILFTFFTRSLRNTIKSLVTRFYRHYKDEDPDWNKIHIRHGWGGNKTLGVYADASRRHGIIPLSFADAQAQKDRSQDAFDYACRSLIEMVPITPFYNHIIIDEGQDFPSGFYELCYSLAYGGRDEKNIVWAYDELQNILNVKIREPEELFGTDEDGLPRVSLDRTSASQAFGAVNDAVLSKCYRNQRDVLVTAHALGFGIYGKIVQLLESADHWMDVGYEFAQNSQLQIGEQVRIIRPPENSPTTLDADDTHRLISWHRAPDAAHEIGWVVNDIMSFINGGLQPEDILVISLDDRHARTYFRVLSEALSASNLFTNNIIADQYSEPPFLIPGRITLSTVYRAKGNEAALVYVIGVDAISRSTRSGRNKLFTAFTRTKGWLRITGSGDAARDILEEVDVALSKAPELAFIMPDLAQVELIQRGLSERSAKARAKRQGIIADLRRQGLTPAEIEDIFNSEFDNG